MSAKHKSLLFCLIFCGLLGCVAIYGLWLAYALAERSASQRTSSTSDLIGEWIKGAFESSDYVLRDIIGDIDQQKLDHPGLDSASLQARLAYLDGKRRSLPHAIFIGVFDANCIATAAVEKLVGLDASQREYCQPFQQNPALETSVTHAFAAVTGPVNVTQARRVSPDGKAFQGVVAIAMDLSFFGKWLDNLQLGEHDQVLITDTRGTVLARRPAQAPDTLLQENASWLTEFIASGAAHQVIHALPIGGNGSSLASLRNVDGLPVVIVVAEGKSTWLADWYARVIEVVVGLLLLWGIAGLALRSHWAMLAQRDRLWEIANIDALTGTASRRHFLRAAQHELDLEARLQHGLALMVLDIDYFKQINDTYGHAVGDRAIVAFTRACSHCLRNVDLLGRIGGDEFAIVLPGLDEPGARTVAARLCQTIAAYQVLIDDEATNTLAMTASIGVAMAYCDDQMLDTVMVRADQALYQAKMAGRNTFAVADDSTQQEL